MRAMRAERFRGYEALKLVELPKPTVTDGKVLVRITAACVTPLDRTILAGDFHIPEKPLILGNEGAGVVEEGGRYDRPTSEVGKQTFPHPRLFFRQFPPNSDQTHLPAGIYIYGYALPVPSLGRQPATHVAELRNWRKTRESGRSGCQFASARSEWSRSRQRSASPRPFRSRRHRYRFSHRARAARGRR
jgi:hypothetical protein